MVSQFKIVFACSWIILFSLSCNDLNIEPEPARVVIDYNDYKPVIDSTYFKLWSDSTWEKFSRYILINGVLYQAIKDNNGKEYLYNNRFELSGFKEPGDSLIIFNEALEIPDQLTLNEVYTFLTMFRYKNINHTVTLKQTFSDTTTVLALSEKFTGCLVVKSSLQITASGEENADNEQLWLARGLNEIKKIKGFRDTVYVVQAVINGKKLN